MLRIALCVSNYQSAAGVVDHVDVAKSLLRVATQRLAATRSAGANDSPETLERSTIHQVGCATWSVRNPSPTATAFSTFLRSSRFVDRISRIGLPR